MEEMKGEGKLITYQIGHYTARWCNPLNYEFIRIIYLVNGLVSQVTPLDPVTFIIDVDIKMSMFMQWFIQF